MTCTKHRFHTYQFFFFSLSSMGILYFCGLEVLTPHVCYEIHESAERREKLLHNWKQRLRTMLDEKPLEFPSYHNR